MTQQKGRELLVKLSDGGDPEAFTNVAGIKSRTFDLSVEEVDTTVPDKLNPGNVVQKTSTAGLRSQSFSGDGLFVKDTESTAVVTAALNGTALRCQIIVPGVGTFTGDWIITGMQFSGSETENLSFSATWSAAGALVFVAEV